MKSRRLERNCRTQTQLPLLRSGYGPPAAFVISREINMNKLCIATVSFGAALAVLPAAAQTGYGVKKHAPSTSSFDRGWNHANESKDRARAGAAYVRRHHASPFGF